MANSETVPTYSIVDIDEYEDNIPERVQIEDMMGSDEVYVFYGRIQKITHAAIRAYVSVEVEEVEKTGIQGSGSITFRDMDFSPAQSDYQFPGIFHARFFVPDRAHPILVKPGLVMKRPIEMGYVVREDDGYDAELLAAAALPTLARNSELITS